MSSSEHPCERAGAALPAIWRRRFEFFDAHGAPNSPEFREAYRHAGDPRRERILRNGFGFLFGPVYFIALGMWRRALTLIGIVLLSGVLALGTVAAVFDVPVDLKSWGIMLVSLAFGFVVSLAALLVVLSLSPDPAGIPHVFMFIVMLNTMIPSNSVNYSYYLTRIKGDNGWNPGQGFWEQRWEMPYNVLAYIFLPTIFSIAVHSSFLIGTVIVILVSIPAWLLRR